MESSSVRNHNHAGPLYGYAEGQDREFVDNTSDGGVARKGRIGSPIHCLPAGGTFVAHVEELHHARTEHAPLCQQVVNALDVPTKLASQVMPTT